MVRFPWLKWSSVCVYVCVVFSLSRASVICATTNLCRIKLVASRAVHVSGMMRVFLCFFLELNNINLCKSLREVLDFKARLCFVCLFVWMSERLPAHVCFLISVTICKRGNTHSYLLPSEQDGQLVRIQSTAAPHCTSKLLSLFTHEV